MNKERKRRKTTNDEDASDSNPVESPEFDAHLRAILDILRVKVGYDFRCYKPDTLVGRIRRRMTLGKIATFGDYAEFLNEHPDEVSLLQKDLLIGVTDFFRQPQAWETLEEKVITGLVKNAQPGSEIRVWVPGCSTGKEAYSLAMLLSEQVEKSGKKMNLQIFATDSDVSALAAARSGIYTEEEIGETVSPERLKRFFSRKDGGYQVNKKIREQIVFAPQNLTADPPFSRLDLISCRNLLIYLDQEVQRKIIALFHFALREGGYLFLGNAESVGDREDLFEPVSKKWRIYRRIGVGRPVGVEIPARPTGEIQPLAEKAPVSPSVPRMSLTSAAQQILLDRFAPACVIIDRKLQVLYVHGAVEDYLTFPPGELTTRVVDMAREGLRARLRGVIGKCLEINKTVSVTARVRRGSAGLAAGGEKSAPVKATVSPLRYPRETDGLLLITFEDYRVSATKSRRKAGGENDVHRLEDELKVTREELQSTIEQMESSNDQLKASNEEVIAANEELQSANEEMETSKEELQSLNEELNTINTRLQEKVEELEGTNNDVMNLLSSTSIATVFLCKELKVKRYTPASTRLFSLIPSDVGRPIVDVLRRFGDETLLNDAAKVLGDLTPLSSEVQAEDGRWYIRRITPYRTQDDRIEGVVVTFVDITDLKQAAEALKESEDRLRLLVEGVQDYAIFMLDEYGHVASWNTGAERIKGWKAGEILGQHFSCFYPPELVAQGHPQQELEIATAAGQFHEEEQRVRKDGSRFWADVTITALRGADGRLRGFAKLTRDITGRKRAEEALREAHDRAVWLARFPDENPNPVVRVSAEGTVLYRNPAAAALPGWTCEVDQPVTERILPVFDRAMALGREAQEEVELGGRFYSVSVAPIVAEGYANVYGRDITERKRAEENIRRQNAIQEAINKIFREALTCETEEELGRTCLRIAGELTQSKFGFIDEINAEGRLDNIAISDPGWEVCRMLDKSGHGKGLPAFKVHGIYGRVAVDGKGFFTNDPQSHPDSIGIPEGHPPLKAFLGAPLFAGGKTIGIVALGNREGGYTQEQQEDLEAIVPAMVQSLLRKRAEQALQESEARLNRSQEIAHLGGWELDLVRNQLTWSDEVYRIFGLQPQEFGATYEAFLEAVHPDDRAAVDAAYAGSVGEGRDSYEIDHRVVRKSTGEIRAVHERCEHIRDESGRIVRSVGMVHDITERKQAEGALRESEIRWRTLLTNIPGIVCRCEAKAPWRTLVMSDGVEAITGIPAAEFLRPNGRVWADLVVPEDLEKVKWVVEEGVTHGKPFEMEYRICRPDESIRWVFERGQAIYDEGGGPRWLDVVIIDITALKQAEEALRDNETRFKLLSETAERLLTAADPQGIVNDLCRDVMDHLGCQVFVNFLVDEEAGRLHLNACAGIPEEEARKIEWLDYGTVVCDCVARDGAPIVAGNICNTPDLRTEWVKSYGVQAYACHPLVVQGKLIGTLSFGTKTRKSFSLEQLALMRTVTDQVATAMERMSLIKELQTSREELEMRVKERTADLAQANEALRQLSARVLSAQEDERKRVAGDIHDTLGSSLNAIRFRVETALQKIGDPSSAASESLNALMPVVREAVEECRRMQQDLRPSMLDDLGILATLSWFCRRFGTTYPGIRVEQKIGVQESEAPDSLKTPIFRITQEAMNNIAKHSKADLIILSLKGEGKRIELTIQDNGMGFDVEGMLSRGRSQRGLGLESMRERVELSGGAFTIESTHGQGTLIRASWGI